jgi:beta-aspartyl-peptidase (threonine type)
LPRLLIGLLAFLAAGVQPASAAERDWAIAIHGGAGVIERGSMSPETEKAYRAAMSVALDKGSGVLKRGGSALDAVEAVIRELEDDPLFNAGRGAVFTAAGRNELDSSIMDGASLKAGAVAGVTRTRHPISLARAVMERSAHVMLIGDGADAFARAQGLEPADPAFFFTERRWRELEQAMKARGAPMPPRPVGAPAPSAAPSAALAGPQPDDHRFGTVGVAALDQDGNLAAGTSTGGLTAKQWGRVGDSPIIGAGTYASNQSCAVSGTGTGEYFIRLTVAREVCALVQYKGLSLQHAADEVIQRQLSALHGDGGVIAVDPRGDIAFSFNTPGMYRASASSRSPARVAIYKDEK